MNSQITPVHFSSLPLSNRLGRTVQTHLLNGRSAKIPINTKEDGNIIRRLRPIVRRGAISIIITVRATRRRKITVMPFRRPAMCIAITVPAMRRGKITVIMRRANATYTAISDPAAGPADRRSADRQTSGDRFCMPKGRMKPINRPAEATRKAAA